MVILGFLMGQEGRFSKVLAFFSRKKGWFIFLCCFAIFIRMAMYTFLARGVHTYHFMALYGMEVIIRVTELYASCFYIWLLSILFQVKFLSIISTAFVAVGRMALTNYILQSILGIFIFYGLGFYGKLLPSNLFLIALTVFVFQSIFSVIWLSYFSYGILEKL